MATKKQIEKLDKLLEWQKEERLFPNVKLFNQKISDNVTLRECSERLWLIEILEEADDGVKKVTSLPLRHKTLVNLGLTILDAITFSRDR